MLVLEVNNLHVYYGSIHAIKDVSFHVDEGEVVSLIGANGAGKTTILHAISGMLKAQRGSITFEGKDLIHVPSHKIVYMGLAQCCEGRRLFLQMSVRENLEMGAYSINPNEVEKLVEEVYELFPRLRERSRQIAGTLSGGEQQMLAIGRAMMSKPKMLMLDEPSMGLAPILVDEIFEIIKALNNKGTTILLVEQNAQMALSISDRGYVLETGKIVQSADAKELLNNDAVRKAYLGG